MLSFGGTAVNDLSLGYTADVDAFTGAATLGVPVAVSEGRNGFNPSLVLAYASGSGNSAYGAGWSLSGVPSIGIDTRRHAPRWDGNDEFCFGNDELVPWLTQSGIDWTPRGYKSGKWTIAFYRSRRGNAKSRVEKWVDSTTGRIHFRTRDAYNRLTIYGARLDSTGRVCDVDDESRTFVWLPELSIDAFGNAQFYEYAKETLDNIERAAAFEKLQPSLSQRYLKRIQYGNDDPLTLTDDLASGAVSPNTVWRLQVVFDYGDHSDPVAPGATPDMLWPARPDAFSTYSCGFEVRTYRLLRRILSFHTFPDLGPNPTLVRVLTLAHNLDPIGSSLEQIVETGYRWDTGALTTAALPPLKLTYAPPAPPDVLVGLPQQSAANAPSGLSRRYSLVDLYGVGMSGMLFQDGRTWYYKENLGAGSFGPQQVVSESPAAPAYAFACADVDADGNTEFAQLAGRDAGLYELTRYNEQWSNFRTFAAFPHVEGLATGARWVDLNGDRRPDLVLSCGDRFVWFPSDGDTFGAPIDIQKPGGPDGIPTLADDASLDFAFADMTGDGMVDLVRVRNGSVEYWPALANGAFGDKVVMEGAPQFAPTDEFDASRLRFADLDGSGTTDLIYLGKGFISCWINARGNALVQGPQLVGLPYFDNVSAVSICDFLGDGRQCLVWSSPLADRESPIEYLPLTPSVQPRLLLSVDDSLGGVTNFTYSSSATHYLRDVASGRGWSSVLPGHRPVVDRREKQDLIANTGSVRTYAYHDGYYDGRERELRGFGCVDLFDSDLASQAPATPGSAGLAPPALERRWFHLGTPMWNPAATGAFYSGDSVLPVLTPHVVDSADVLSADEIDDGLRILAGELVRQERYTLDTSGAIASDPLEVVQRRFRIRPLQPRYGRACAAFSKIPLEYLTAVYESVANDPRVNHEIVLQADDYEQPLSVAEIAYPRRAGIPTDVDAQSNFHLSIRNGSWIAFDADTRYEFGIPCESKVYELAGLRPALQLFTRDDFDTAAVNAALAAPGRHDVELTDNPVLGSSARLLSWERTFYWDDGLANALALQSAGAITLLHHEEAACFEPAFSSDVFAARIDDALLTSLGYQEHDGFWWLADETHVHFPAAQFFGLQSHVRGDGATTSFIYDTFNLIRTGFTDPLNNAVQAVPDYYQLALRQITDPNGTIREVRYDPLGVIVASSTRGSISGNAWGSNALPVTTPWPASAAAVVAGATALVADAAEYTWYDLTAWTSSGAPTTVVTLAREALINDGNGGGTAGGPVQVVVSYIDGGGRTLQEKALVAPGPAISRDGSGNVVVDGSGTPVLAPAATRWRASGFISYDAKERPGRDFEPFFSPTFAYESDAVLRTYGTSTLTHYDVLGRAIGQSFANGTFTSVAYNAWSLVHSDTNDNVIGSDYEAARKALPAGDPELQAYQETLPHANTPQITYLDSLGREVGLLSTGGSTAPDALKQTSLDPNGDAIQSLDPRGLVATRTRYDMQRRAFYQFSVDAGERWRLPDSYGRETNEWDSRTFAVVRSFDAADRPTSIDVSGGDGAAPLNNRVETWTYGEDLANRAAAIAANLLGNAAIVRDAAGETTFITYDPDGKALQVTHQLRSAVDNAPDWKAAVALDGEIVTESATFDALGRVASDVLADGSTRSFMYDQGGVLTTVRLTTPDGSIKAVPILNGADVNARGQRIDATLGNGAALAFTYASDTYRIAGQAATRPGSVFQQIAYTYDAVGNLVRLTDAAQEGATALISGLTVPARRDYVYDAHYRIRQATGRVHQALLMNDFVPGAPGTFKGTRHITLNNGAAIERFTRTYDYDTSGNMLYEKHAGTSQSWTDNMWISTTSNRSMPALDLNGNPIAAPEASYDGGGNQASLSHLRSIGWSWRNALQQAVIIVRPGGTNDGESYVYGADDLRARKVATRLVSEGLVEITDTAYFNDIERKRISRNGTLVFERWSTRVNDGYSRIAIVNRWTKDDLGLETSDITKVQVRYQLSTHQASVAIELDENAALISYEEYFPYGGTAFIAGDNQLEVGLKDYRYSGQVGDDVTGLYAYGFRYYATWMCRWLSPDPSGPSDDLNLYQFALGDPVRNVDPDGLDSDNAGKVQYVDRDVAELPANPTDDQRIAAERSTLAPEMQSLFDSLSRADQLRFASSSDMALVYNDFDNPGAGGRLISRAQFFRTYLPKAVAWAKKHGKAVGIERAPTERPTTDNDDAGLGDPDAPPTATDTHDESGSGQAKSGGGSGNGTNDGAGTGTGNNGAGANAGANAGTGTTTTGTSANAGDGNGTTITGSPTGVNNGNGITGNGNGAANGKGGGAAGAGDGSGERGDRRGKTKIPGTDTGANLGSAGSEFGVEKGGREDGVLGGTPFSPGNSLDNLGDPISNGSSSNGSDKDGQTSTTRRRPGSGGSSPDGSNKGKGAGKGKGTGRGAPTGSAGSTGTNPKGSLDGTTAANAHPNSNATGHSAGDGSGKGASGDTGATASILKVAGYLNLEFGDGDANGEAGGIPGGAGKFKGAFWQFLYVAVTVIDTIMIVKSIIKSVAEGALRRMFNAVRSPRALIREFRAFLNEAATAFRKQWGSGIKAGLGQVWRGMKSLIWEKGFQRITRGARAGVLRTMAEEGAAVIQARNRSFWFKPRWFGKVGGRLYSTEHIIPKSWAAGRPWLRPFVQSYANTFLRLPTAFNSALGNRVIPKAVFYYGAARALMRSWQFGTWVGQSILNQAAQPDTNQHPER